MKPVSKKTAAELKKLRAEIDVTDRELLRALGRRFQIVEKLGRLKRRESIPIVQKKRHREILDARARQGKQARLRPAFVRTLFKLIHDESVTRQKQGKRKP